MKFEPLLYAKYVSMGKNDTFLGKIQYSQVFLTRIALLDPGYHHLSENRHNTEGPLPKKLLFGEIVTVLPTQNAENRQKLPEIANFRVKKVPIWLYTLRSFNIAGNTVSEVYNVL